MPTMYPTDRSWSAGVPEQWTQDFGVLAEGLVTGEVPEQFVMDMPVALNQTLPAYTVVALDGSGNVIKSVSGTNQAIGFIVYPVTTGGSGSLPAGRICRGGCFNPDRLAFDTSYNTAVKKLNAFNGAPSPTQIVLRGLAQHTPVAP